MVDGTEVCFVCNLYRVVEEGANCPSHERVEREHYSLYTRLLHVLFSHKKASAASYSMPALHKPNT